MEASIAAGVTLFDTAAMYAGGASERRLGQFRSDAALIATKFPATSGPKPRICPGSSPTVWAGCNATTWTCTSTTSPPDGSTSHA